MDLKNGSNPFERPAHEKLSGSIRETLDEKKRENNKYIIGAGIGACEHETQHMYHQFLRVVSRRRRYQRMCYQKAHVANQVGLIAFPAQHRECAPTQNMGRRRSGACGTLVKTWPGRAGPRISVKFVY